MHTKPRIAICGIHIESSTFTPYISDVADFVVTRGDELLARYSWLDKDWATAVEWLPVLHARALPGGVVARSAYDAWKQEILTGLAALGELDGLFFDIHGAMSVIGLDDAEGDLISAIRAVIGEKPLVSASMDLHGNVSEELFAGCDLLTCYRMAPHEDALESRERAARNLAQYLVAGKAKPVKALAHVPILLPGEKTSTRVEPAKSLYALVPEAAAQPGVTDAAIWVGFAWADQPRCKGAVVVYGEDTAAVTAQCERLANAFWQARDRFEFVAPVDSFAGCLQWAETAARPTMISDSGDNPGAGGADDVTCALAELLAWAPVQQNTLNVIHASIVDRAAAHACAAAGIGETLELEVGGKIDTRAPGPQCFQATVVALADDPTGGVTAAVKTGGLTLIITENRNQYTTHEQFARLGLDVRKADVVVVKIGYLEPDLHEAAASWKMALTPGGVDQDLLRLCYNKINRPMFPFDPEAEYPPLQVQVVEPQ